MKVLYVGVHEGTCLSRFNTLRTIEPDTTLFAINRYIAGLGKWGRFFERNMFYGPRAQLANAELLQRCGDLGPDVVWVDKNTWIWPSTLRALRRRHVFLAHHFTDAIHPRDAQTLWGFWLLRRSLPIFNINFSTNIDDVNALRQRGRVSVELTHLAFDQERFDDSPLLEDVAREWAAEMLFIGHHEPRTERFVGALLDARIPIKVYGWGWGRQPIARKFPEAITGRMLSDKDYVRAIKGAKIALCCVSEMNYNQTAARSYEIPASGTFLLAMRTPQHLESYAEGREAEFFDTPDELVRKARFYLEHDAQRIAIAKAGHDRCVGDDYTWARYMRDDWEKTKAAYNRWKTSDVTHG